MPPRIDETGKRYGRWTVLSCAGNSPEHNNYWWVCRCDCGVISKVRGQSLRQGKSKSCGCFRDEESSKRRRLPIGVAAVNNLLINLRYHANKRGHKWLLSDEHAISLLASNCFYCGTAPQQVWGRNFVYGRCVYNGIDRIDSSRNYEKNNVVPCCKSCNYAKRTMSQEDFKSWVKRVHEHWASKD